MKGNGKYNVDDPVVTEVASKWNLNEENVQVTHGVITVLDVGVVRITRMRRMICGSLGFVR